MLLSTADFDPATQKPSKTTATTVNQSSCLEAHRQLWYRVPEHMLHRAKQHQKRIAGNLARQGSVDDCAEQHARHGVAS